MDKFLNAFLPWLQNFCIAGVKTLGNLPVLKHGIIYMSSTYTLGFIFFITMCFMAFANQIKTFSPSATTRPLPYRYRLVVNFLTYVKYMALVFFSYLWLYNSCFMFLANIDYFRGSAAILFLHEYLYLSVYLVALGLMIRFKFDAIPFLKATIDRTIIKKLNRISIEYQAKNTNRETYHPDGKERKTKSFNPTKYFKNNHLFHGLDEYNKAIYTDLEESLDGHLCIIGGSGMGKGVLTRIYLAQTLKKDIAHVIFDPKPDNFMFNACQEFARKNNKKIHIIDLDNETPQIALFKNIVTIQQILIAVHKFRQFPIKEHG